MKETILYIFLFIIVVFTVLNILSHINQKKKKDAYNKKFSSIFQPIENDLLDAQKKYGCHFSSITRVMNDRDEGIVVVKDEEKKIAAVAMKDFLTVTPFDDIADAKIKESKPSHTIDVSVRIKDDYYTFEIATKRYMSISFTRLMCMRMAKNLVDALTF